MPLRTLFAGTILLLVTGTIAFGGEPALASATTGRLHLTFTERSPLGPLDVLCRRSGFKSLCEAISRDAVNSAANPVTYELAGESFEVYVPDSYKPADPVGLFVWISSGAAEVESTWFDVFRRRKLIWICPNNAGNRRPAPVRAGLALDAVHNIKRIYNIDPSRIYIAGFSGGGSVASLLVRSYPNVFNGAYLIMGYQLYGGRKNESGRWEADIRTPTFDGPLEQIKKDLRLVIMGGQADRFTWPGGDRANNEALVLDGFQRVSFFEIPRFGHYHPNAAWFEKGIVALDQAKPKPPPTTMPTTQPNPGAGQIAQAKRILTSAQVYLDIKQRSAGSRDRARLYLQQVLKEYPSTPSAAKARKLLDELDQPTTRPGGG